MKVADEHIEEFFANQHPTLDGKWNDTGDAGVVWTVKFWAIPGVALNTEFQRWHRSTVIIVSDLADDKITFWTVWPGAIHAHKTNVKLSGAQSLNNTQTTITTNLLQLATHWNYFTYHKQCWRGSNKWTFTFWATAINLIGHKILFFVLVARGAVYYAWQNATSIYFRTRTTKHRTVSLNIHLVLRW